MKKISIVFSKPKDFPDPLSVMGAKRPVYEELVDRTSKEGIEMVIASTKGYKGDGEFEWYWDIKNGRVTLQDSNIKVDLAYDRSGGLSFPIEGDKLIVVDNLDFKKFAWNKWEAYKLLSAFMPQTYLFEDRDKIKTDWIVLKPSDGLKGKGIYIGPKFKMGDFTPFENRQYIACEFVDTSSGIPGIVNGVHDLRVVVINGKPIWSHVRVPPSGEYKANVAGGGILKEVEINMLPEKVTNIVQNVSDILYNRFDNPIYSIDFGVSKSGEPYIFEINDQMGFPKPNMIAKDLFLSEMIENFKSKLV